MGEGRREGSSHEGRSAGICFDKLRHPEILWLRRVSVGAFGESGKDMGGRRQAGYLKTEGGRKTDTDVARPWRQAPGSQIVVKKGSVWGRLGTTGPSPEG